MTRVGLRQLIYEHVDLRVACEADAEPQALDMLLNHEIDILLLDLPQSVHPSIDALSSIQCAAPGLRVLVFTSYSVQHGALASFLAGARGYLNKSCESYEIVQAIRTMALGNRFFSREVTDMLARQLSQNGKRAPLEHLSGRELHADSVTLLDGRDASAKRRDDAFVARRKRQRRLQGPVASGGMKVGMANATSFRLDQNLARAGLGHVEFLQDQRLAEMFDLGGLHLACHGEFLAGFVSRSGP